MDNVIEKYLWSEISKIPDIPGVYAWYFVPEITDFDLHHVLEKITNVKKKQGYNEAAGIVREFLDKNLFSVFKEEPYNVELCGQLKPRYHGQIQHVINISDSLVERFVDEPKRLKLVKKVIEKTAPHFASPIYIGMSETLGTRLRRHKLLIEKYRSESRYDKYSNADDKDNSFAKEVCKRNLSPSRLVVYIDAIKTDEKICVDIENMLNRIYFPILGRN